MKLKPLTDFDKECLMTIEQFIEDVETGGLIDYDGYGKLCTETEISHITIYPSEIGLLKMTGHKFTHVAWYNN